MSEEVERTKPTVKKVARYFSQRTDNDVRDANQIRTDQSKKPIAFDGEVIEVKARERFMAKSKFRNKRPDKIVNPFLKNKNKRKFVKTEIDPYALDRHSRGDKVTGEGIKTEYFKEKFKRKEVYQNFAVEQAARAELLLNEEEGFIVPDDDVPTAEYSQREIIDNVDITTASKHFNLNLDFGPYRMRYTKNGRHLLLGGKKGHIAAFDWVTKKLHCEFNAMEEVYDVTWLHLETMFAVAQKNWVHFYDNQGTEIHCIKKMHRIRRLDFLPYHFLVVSINELGFLTWVDTSIGEMVANYSTKVGSIAAMAHNPFNGVTCVGGSKGVVSMWSPTVREPLAKMLCHPTPLIDIAVDPKGVYLATSGIDKHVKIWDIRALSGPVVDYSLRSQAQSITMSQRGLLALGMGNQCEIYKKPNLVSIKIPYLRHSCPGHITDMHFCPFEDVLGLGTEKGFHSLIVPGAGEPNFDALEANPYQTKSQRKESEVHSLLDKIPAELIKLNPDEIAQVDVPTMKENIDAKKSLLFLKAPKVDFKQRKKMKGKGGSVNAFKAKKIVRDQVKQKFIQEIRDVKQQIISDHSVNDKNADKTDEQRTPLDRFKSKKKTKS